MSFDVDGPTIRFSVKILSTKIFRNERTCYSSFLNSIIGTVITVTFNI